MVFYSDIQYTTHRLELYLYRDTSKKLFEMEKCIMQEEIISNEDKLIIRPEKVKTETHLKFIIDIDNNTIKIEFCEFNNAFRILIKQYGFVWNKPYWIRRINSINNINDVAIDIARRLLINGFCIMVFDNDIYKRIISGEYKPEITKWIAARRTGKYKDWFSIHWTFSENLYTKAKRITGAIWDNPNIVVSLEHFEEVIDFATIYNFQFSDGAKKLIEKAKELKTNSFIINILEKENIESNNQLDILNITGGIEILNEFKDDIITPPTDGG